MPTRTQVLIPIVIAAFIVGSYGLYVFFNSEISDDKQQSVEFPQGTIKLDDEILVVKIADNDALRIRGLMFHDELPFDQGMLFVFDGSETRSMWMLNMQFPLDVIWFDENLRVTAIEKNIPPCITTIEVVTCRDNGVSGDNAKYVLEVTAGFVDKFNITENSKLEIISI
jgi:uncharacterized membrane protein (UPF0127 family)